MKNPHALALAQSHIKTAILYLQGAAESFGCVEDTEHFVGATNVALATEKALSLAEIAEDYLETMRQGVISAMTESKENTVRAMSLASLLREIGEDISLEIQADQRAAAEAALKKTLSRPISLEDILAKFQGFPQRDSGDETDAKADASPELTSQEMSFDEAPAEIQQMVRELAAQGVHVEKIVRHRL